jgi:tRNA U38,U39,U40 pseudouridine synthase TruA
MVIAYEGGNFMGWQKMHPKDSPKLRTVEEVLEACLRPLFRQVLSIILHRKHPVATFPTLHKIQIHHDQ